MASEDSIGKRAAAVISSHGRWPLDPGLTPDELRELEGCFGITFQEEHRAFLAECVPVGTGWPDWRTDDHDALRAHLDGPRRDVLDVVARGELWPKWFKRPAPPRDVEYVARHLALAPKVLPVFESDFIGQGDTLGTSSVWRMGDVEPELLAHDLEDYVRLLCDQPRVPTPASFRRVTPMWLGKEDVGDHLLDLGAPPFDPDRPITLPDSVIPPDAVPATLGVDCPDLTPHEGLVVEGTAWSFTLPADQRDAIAVWEAVRELHPTTGWWPVMVTDAFWERVRPNTGLDPHTVPELLAAPPGHQWLTERMEAIEVDELPRRKEPRNRTFDDWRELWQWREYPTMTRLLLVPTPAGWLIPGLLSWDGAVNVDVGPLEHTTMLRRWAARWELELVAMDDEQLIVCLPWVLAVNQGLTVALETHLYCPDNTDQNFGSLDQMAMHMLTSTLWDFWWD